MLLVYYASAGTEGKRMWGGGGGGGEVVGGTFSLSFTDIVHYTSPPPVLFL